MAVVSLLSCRCGFKRTLAGAAPLYLSRTTLAGTSRKGALKVRLKTFRIPKPPFIVLCSFDNPFHMPIHIISSVRK